MQTVGGRLRAMRHLLKISQGDLASVMRLEQHTTVSNWELGKTPADPGALRLASDLCQDSLAVFRWLEEGGPMPPILRISSPKPSEPAARPDGDTRFAEGYRAGFDAGFEKGRQLGGPPDPARSNRVQNHQ